MISSGGICKESNLYHILMNLSRVKCEFCEVKIEKEINECYNYLVYFKNRFLTQGECFNSRRKLYDMTQNIQPFSGDASIADIVDWLIAHNGVCPKQLGRHRCGGGAEARWRSLCRGQQPGGEER